ncbi:hypothetical protein J7F03_34470 [Streptomyces sp. ISL-43]|uniref:hypothetical protein n=1 Tax=Streptomyces sp. ISL-43 TaxID=2819183 RepID=UPI001BE8EAA8|nr:hypothetical protein [Streptomyces sp. ISL-43]MBT2452077.1 hypothetical protein [Streptomyces sp. ISL-43]
MRHLGEDADAIDVVAYETYEEHLRIPDPRAADDEWHGYRAAVRMRHEIRARRCQEERQRLEASMDEANRLWRTQVAVIARGFDEYFAGQKRVQHEVFGFRSEMRTMGEIVAQTADRVGSIAEANATRVRDEWRRQLDGAPR